MPSYAAAQRQPRAGTLQLFPTCRLISRGRLDPLCGAIASITVCTMPSPSFGECDAVDH
jgi:hypothetical protein